MNQALKTWVDKTRQKIESEGFNIAFVDGHQSNSYGVNLDSERFVGGIFYWPESTYELQFLDFNSGDLLLLETKNISDVKLLEEYLNQVLFKRLVDKNPA